MDYVTQVLTVLLFRVAVPLNLVILNVSLWNSRVTIRFIRKKVWCAWTLFALRQHLNVKSVIGWGEKNDFRYMQMTLINIECQVCENSWIKPLAISTCQTFILPRKKMNTDCEISLAVILDHLQSRMVVTCYFVLKILTMAATALTWWKRTRPASFQVRLISILKSIYFDDVRIRRHVNIQQVIFESTNSSV